MAIENALIKKPYTKTAYTDEQIAEFIKCSDPVTGPQYFLTHYFYIQHPIRGRILYQPYPFQNDLIETYVNNKFSIALISRQMGKTTTAAGYLLWYAMFRPDSTILIAAHKYSGAQEIMSRIRFSYEEVPDYIRAGVTAYNKGSIEFDQGSRIVSQATTENTGRGMSVTLLYLDEFGFVRNTIASDLWTSIRPTLATGGGAIITSTPNSDEDEFAQIWKGANKTEDEYGNQTDVGINGFKAFSADWRAHPDRDEEWARVEREAIGEERFKREHENQFIIFSETLISSIKLADLGGVEPIRKTGQVRWYETPKPDMLYVVALDPSLGTGGDASAIQVYEANTTKQVAEWKHNKTPIPKQIKILAEVCEELSQYTKDQNNIYYSIENNTLGEAALISLEEYGENNIKGIFLSAPRDPKSNSRYRKGFNTTNKSKLAACAKFKNLVESDKMTIKSKGLITELKHFVASGASYSATPGEHDDLVMSSLLAVRMLGILSDFHKELSKQYRDYGDEIIPPMPFIALL